jgi:hypothetical protein
MTPLCVLILHHKTHLSCPPINLIYSLPDQQPFATGNFREGTLKIGENNPNPINLSKTERWQEGVLESFILSKFLDGEQMFCYI